MGLKMPDKDSALPFEAVSGGKQPVGARRDDDPDELFLNMIQFAQGPFDIFDIEAEAPPTAMADTQVVLGGAFLASAKPDSKPKLRVMPTPEPDDLWDLTFGSVRL